MSLCPICGKYLCDHTSEERGQTSEEMMTSLTRGEITAFNKGNSSKKIAVARRVRDAQKTRKGEKK